MYTDFYNVKEALKLFKEKKASMENIMESDRARKEAIEKTEEILKELKDVGVDSKPLPILASSFYISAILSGHAKTQKEVCSTIGISIYLLRKSYKVVEERLYDCNIIESRLIL